MKRLLVFIFLFGVASFLMECALYSIPHEMSLFERNYNVEPFLGDLSTSLFIYAILLGRGRLRIFAILLLLITYPASRIMFRGCGGPFAPHCTGRVESDPELLKGLVVDIKPRLALIWLLRDRERLERLQ
jgi:hypothetical protein